MGQSGTAPLVQTSGLTKKFGDLLAVENLTLAVEAGQILGLLGPKDAGKTTTLRMLAGIIAATSGQARVAGFDPSASPEKLHEMIGFLPESPGLYGKLSARRNLEYFAGFYRGIDGSRIEAQLKAVGLWERREDKIGSFSKGMKQRLALARALVHDPVVLLLDEPTAGLDPQAGRELRQMITTLREQGKAIILSTHNLPEAESLCDRIAVVHTRLLAMDTPRALRERLFQREIEVELQKPNELAYKSIKDLPYVKAAIIDGCLLRVELSEPETMQPNLIATLVKAGAKIMSVTEKRHSLEEIYLDLLHKEADGKR